MRGADLRGIDLSNLPLSCLRGGLTSLEWHKALEESRAAAKINLKGANLRAVHFDGAILREANLENANLKYAHFEGAYLRYARLGGAKLGGAFFDSSTKLDYVNFNDEQGHCASLGGVRWGNVDITGIKWSKIDMLGDERKVRDLAQTLRDKENTPAEQPNKRNNEDIQDDDQEIDVEANQANYGNDNEKLDEQQRKVLINYHKAVRAYRQLAVLLQSQGLNEEAAKFSYHAQKLQRIVFRLERKYPEYIFSGILNLFAGYGYRPYRFFLATLIIVAVFSAAYYIITAMTGARITLWGAIALSIQNLFTPDFKLQALDLLKIIGAVEGLCGLFIAAILIAIVSQRILGK